jgi:hypothetical protein
MRGARTAQVIEEDDIMAPEPPRPRVRSRITGLHYPPGNVKSPPTKLDHFRHERELVECSLSVQGLEDFVGCLHFDEVARVKSPL